MFKLRKRGDYLAPRTTETPVDLEHIICASEVKFDVTFQDYQIVESSADDPDYLPS